MVFGFFVGVISGFIRSRGNTCVIAIQINAGVAERE